MNDPTTNHLLEIKQFSEWNKNGMKRVYLPISYLAQLWKLNVRTYSSGRVSSAQIDGEKISNSRATRVIIMFQLSKIHYDIAAGELKGNCPANILKKVSRLIRDEIEMESQVVNG